MSTTPAPAETAPDPAAARPSEGPGSMARLLPRAGALIIDWALCSLIAAALLGYRWGGSGAEGFKPLAVFAVENALLVSTLGTTIGHRIFGLAVRRADGTPPGFLAGLVRTALLCLALPAAFSDRYGRGWHDKAAGTLILRSR